MKLKFTDDALKAIAKRAIARKDRGAGACARSWRTSCSNTMFDLPSAEGVEEVVVNEEAVSSRRAAPDDLRRAQEGRAGKRRLDPGAHLLQEMRQSLCKALTNVLEKDVISLLQKADAILARIARLTSARASRA